MAMWRKIGDYTLLSRRSYF